MKQNIKVYYITVLLQIFVTFMKCTIIVKIFIIKITNPIIGLFSTENHKIILNRENGSQKFRPCKLKFVDIQSVSHDTHGCVINTA